jgi:ubiquinol-cytochrome c reductase cytochrome b subunit
MKALLDWLDHRTGCKKLLHEALFENVPGGSRWRYVWGSTLSFTLAIQFITGVFLWMAYNPSSQTAWESVYYIQNEMLGGWLLRGLHHYTAQAMNVLLVLHLMQVMIDGAYKAPREINFWFGLGLLGLVMGLSLTGYLLPWDQKGYWATKVATSIASITPLIGPEVQRLIVGGADYGHHTLSRFFALHAGVLPGAIVVLLVAHIYLFRRHGLTPAEPRRKPDEAFWPDQVLKDAVACLAVLTAVLVLVVKFGAELGAPADPAENYAAARPEWYFLFLFQLLKYFPGQSEIVGAMIIPGLVMGIVFLMPMLGRRGLAADGQIRRALRRWEAPSAFGLKRALGRRLQAAAGALGHCFNLCFLWALILGIGLLTWLAWRADHRNPIYQVAVKQAERDAERVRVLAHGPRGIPSDGAVALLRQDPYTQGPKLFAKNCASCHRYDGHDGLGLVATNSPSASDLNGFGTRAWLAGLLDPGQVATARYFGGTKLADGKMVKFVKKDVAGSSPETRAQLTKVLAALSAEAGLKAQRDLDQIDAALIREGQALLASPDLRCTECHQFHKADEDATAPELTGYGSREWLLGMVRNPKHTRYYGKRNDRMPAFGQEKILDERALGLIVDWLRHDWYEPTGLEPAQATQATP